MDEVLEALLQRNAQFVAGYDPNRSVTPKLELAILCCMDHRVTSSLNQALGLTPDSADLITNAGGLATDDAIRSLAVSQRLKGTRRIIVIGHTGCGMVAMDEPALRAEIERETGSPAPKFFSFRDARESVIASVNKLRSDLLLPNRDQIEGFVFDLDSGELVPVDPSLKLNRPDSRGLR